MIKSNSNSKDQAWLAHYQKSLSKGLSITGYAAKAGLKSSSFHSAIKRLRAKGLIPAANAQQLRTALKG